MALLYRFCYLQPKASYLKHIKKNAWSGEKGRQAELSGAQGLVKDFVFYLEKQEKSLNYSLGK